MPDEVQDFTWKVRTLKVAKKTWEFLWQAIKVLREVGSLVYLLVQLLKLR